MIPSPSTPQNPNPDPANLSDLSTTLASLKTLITLSHQTLQNPQLLPPKSANDHFVSCPYNPHHLMPPDSLFLHTLRCPVPLSIDPPNYETTLHTSSYLHHQKTNFTLQDFSQELCFSIDDYFSCSGYSSFFYKDCPAVVSLSDVDASSTNTSSSKKTFTIPGFLSVECANVVCCDGVDAKRKVEGFGEVGFRILGSDLWFIRSEIEGWNDYEYVTVCSFNVVCAILGLKMVRECDLKKWLVVNSPRYGVVIDVYMRDHIFVLVGLCLKAVVREALGFVELAKGREMEMGLKSLSFKCPLLTQALKWLTSQLAVLYGNVNGKLFAISIFKHCVLESASRLLFSLDQNLTKSFDLEKGHRSLHFDNNNIHGVKVEEPVESSTEGQEGETVDSMVVFMYQVAAAIAALHERSWLEEKIRALRVSQPLTSYQRMAEHTYLSNRADEERKRRPNYRPIIEHDGLPRQHSSNQETNKTKTREELLAEERDYKRRRMSYRGKKVKRTTLQVMRDIIEEYMEEIKQAGGIGCFEKEDEDGETFSSELSAYDQDSDASRKSKGDSFQATRGGPNYGRKQSQYDYNFKSTAVKDGLPRNKQSRWGFHGHREHLENHRSGTDREKYGGEYYNSSSERHRSHDRSYERSSHKREREDVDLTRSKHNKIKRSSSSRSNYSDDRSSYPVSNSRQRNTHDSSTASHVPNAFEDRYDPSESHDWYGYDVNKNSDMRTE